MRTAIAARDILALDVSATSTGWARGGSLGLLCPPKRVGTGAQRLAWIRDEVEALAAPLVVIEGYAFNVGKQGRSASVLAEVGGVVRLALYDAGSWVVELSPSVRQKIATGNGSAKKEAVLAAAIRRLGYRGSSFDEADALWIQQAAFSVYRIPEAATLPKSHDPVGLKGYRADTWPTAEAVLENWWKNRERSRLHS